MYCFVQPLQMCVCVVQGIHVDQLPPQRLFWMAAEGMLLERFRGSGAVADAVAQLLPAVARGELTPRAGAERAVARFMGTTDALP